jgi:hypothetical protein
MIKSIGLAVAIWCAQFCFGAIAGTRAIPKPLPSHPGNIFLSGEIVVVPLSAGANGRWQAVDYDGKIVAQGDSESGHAKLGVMPVGYYELTGEGTLASNRVYLGVVEELRSPTPLDSPIGIDVALAWCFPREQWASAISLCQLAGMNRVRDRMSWPEIEPKRGEFIATTKYDDSLKMQTDAGLQVLQVNHIAAPWANTNDAKRIPPDLRDIYNTYRELARRWKGNIVAFEPWNEADIKEFGGHTGDEMASLQKAAYLGLKAGNPDLSVCQNVFAIRRLTTLRNFNENKAWAYFDNFDVHHYEPIENYPKMYEDYRSVSAGKPVWTTECNMTVEWSGDEQRKEPNEENLRIQSERVAKIYAMTIHEGVKAVFYFMLPHYSERKIQYGVIHPDLTPRPAYLSVAAAGRLLAGAERLGQVESKDKRVQGYLFAAKPDGKDTDVLVIWANDEGEFKLPKTPMACFDLLGRQKSVEGETLKLTRAPIYVELAKGSRPTLMPLPELAPLLKGKAWPIVLQAVLPPEEIALNRSAYKMPAGPTNVVPVFIYNFGTTKARGKLIVTAPDGWTKELASEVDIAPGERKEVDVKLATAKDWDQAARVQVKGDFGDAGTPLLALRFVDQPK